jgi:hypothetical protein
VSEPRSRRRGRGIDAIFDATDLTLEPRAESQNSPEPTEGSSHEPLHQQEDRPLQKKRRGRPRLEHPPVRELVQRGFYLEPVQDRMIDEIKVKLKSCRVLSRVGQVRAGRTRSPIQVAYGCVP